MNNTKYVVLDYMGFDTMFIFPAFVTHSYFVREFANVKVVSAGFLEIRDGKVKAFGESVSLNVKSHPRDSRIAEKVLNLREYSYD